MSNRPAFLTLVRRPALIALSAALTGSLVLAGCGGGSDKKSSDGPQAQSTDGGTALAAIQPLTGLAASGSLPQHPAVFVKIDNSPASDPQIGVGSADIVFEELVEGGITRLAVGFYSRLPKVAGPVRSARATDIGIVLPTKGALLASGAAPSTIKRLKSTGVNYHSNDSGAAGLYRDTSDHSHDYLHSVFANMPKFVKSLGKASPPPSYLPWGSEKDFVGVQAAKNVNVQFSSGYVTRFRYAGGKYVYTNSFMKAGDRFNPDSVLVLRVTSRSAGYVDPNGSYVPESQFYGTGQAVLFHHGQLVRGTWTKPTRSSAVQLKTLNGNILVPAGKVWVALLPVKDGDPRLTFS